MPHNLHFCKRCLRPVPPNVVYCSDCEAIIKSPLMSQPRCSNCGSLRKDNETMFWNKKLKKIYCLSCLQTFRQQLVLNEMPPVYIRKIIREDFLQF